mgnify:CR=1 FL=1
MAWYKPWTWTELSRNHSTLYCANPGCKDPLIHNTSVIYDRRGEEVYHSGECAIDAAVHKRPEGEKIIMLGNYEYLHRDTALDLARRGKVKMPAGLESKV